MTQLVWDKPPNRKFVTAVDAGAVVLVRINPSKPTATLAQDANGVPPHLVFIADIASRGTTANVATNAFGNVVEVGEKPTATGTDQLGIDKGSTEFFLDVGRAFLCPFAGTIAIEGGVFTATDGGVVTTTPYEINAQVVMPQEIAITMPFRVGGNVLKIDRRYVERQTGEWIRRRPTMTYFKVGATPVQIPRGAVDVQVNATQNVIFQLGGNVVAHPLGTLSLSIPAGPPLPLGFISQGTFSSAGTIDWISFGIEVG